MPTSVTFAICFIAFAAAQVAAWKACVSVQEAYPGRGQLSHAWSALSCGHQNLILHRPGVHIAKHSSSMGVKEAKICF